MMRTFSLLLILLFTAACQKETITFSTRADDQFFLENVGASMRINVKGNTLSKVFVILVHGGPGASAYIYQRDYYSNHLENKLAMVYWDQRNSGGTQGNSNGRYLHLNQMVDDLKKVIELIRYRYGEDSRIYILGQSFGGLLTAAFLTTGNNQDMVSGWICVDGSHNYPLNDTLTRNMLLNEGEQQVSLHKNEGQWQDIINYCKAHTGNFNFDESTQLEAYGKTAETLIDSARQINFLTWFLKYGSDKNYPLSSIAVNYLYNLNSDFLKELSKAEYSSVLNKVRVPVLLLWGKYDFICPEGLAEDIYNRVSSAYKRIVISPVTGHFMMLLDEELFCNEVTAFIEQNP